MKMKTPEQVAAFFGCTPEQVRAQFRKNAVQLSVMAAKSRRTGRKANLYTAEQLTERAEAAA